MTSKYVDVIKYKVRKTFQVLKKPKALSFLFFTTHSFTYCDNNIIIILGETFSLHSISIHYLPPWGIKMERK